MIRKLMASSAVLALVTAGAFSPAQAQTTAAPDAQQPAAMEPAATPDAGAATTDTAAGEADATLTPDQPTIASAFMGRSVFSSEDPESDNIGEVNDLIIGDQGMITHAVVGVGGFLGIGEKDVAVPFDELQVIENDDGEIRLIYASNREQLEAAEAFDRTAFDPRDRAAEEQQAMANTGAATDGVATAPGALPGTATDTATTPAVPMTDTAADTAMTAPAETTTPAPAETTAPAADTATTDMAAAPATDAAAPKPGEAGFVNYSADQVRASSMMGQQIYGPDNESIGEVSDLVLRDDGQTRSALIDVGGFLGVGEKEVAIPFSDIKVAPNPDNANAPRLTVAMTREQLEQAPAYEDPARMTVNNAAAPAAGTATAPDPNAAGTMAPATGTDTAMTPDASAGAGDAAMNAQYAPVTQDLTADNLIGSAVYGQNDDNIGEVGDVVFDPKGAIQAVVVDVGGFLGIGEKPVAVQYDALNVQKNGNGDFRLMLNTTQQQLEAAPAYNADAAAAGQPQPTVQ